MASVEQSNITFGQRLYNWFGGGDSTGFILKMLFPALFVFTIGILFPLIYGVVVSMYYYKTQTERFFVFYQNYQLLFDNPKFWRSYTNTIFFVLVTVSLETIFGMLVALVLNKEFKGRGIVRASILVPWAIPTIVNARIWQYIFGATLRNPVNDILVSWGIRNTPITFSAGRTFDTNWIHTTFLIIFIITIIATAYSLYTKYTDKFSKKVDFSRNEYILYGLTLLSLIMIVLPNSVYAPQGGALSFASRKMEYDWIVVIVVDVWKTTPFMALLILAGLQVIPADLLKAAEVDGANSWQKFRNVTLPLLLPSIGVALLFRLIDAFRVYDIFAIFSWETIEPITKFAVRKHSQGHFGQSSAIAIFEFINIIVMTLIVMGLTRRRTDV